MRCMKPNSLDPLFLYVILEENAQNFHKTSHKTLMNPGLVKQLILNRIINFYSCSSQLISEHQKY